MPNFLAVILVMMPTPLLRVVLLLALAIALVSCGAVMTPTPESPHVGRYSITQDRAPSLPVDITTIPEVIPMPVTRTISGNRSPYTIQGISYSVMPTEAGYKEYGTASWYGEKFHGHKTSNGEIFDMYKATAAHKSLPIPSFLKVTNLDNNRSIVVRVNDRGPFHGDRLIDLSYGAAMKLGYAEKGIVPVRLEAIEVDSMTIIDDETVNTQKIADLASHENGCLKKFLQIGAYATLDNAQRISHQVTAMTSRPVTILSRPSINGSILHRVRVGPLSDSSELKILSSQVVAAGLGSPYTISE